MMHPSKNISHALQIAQVVFWIIMGLFPVFFNLMSHQGWTEIWNVFKMTLSFQAPLMFLHLLDFYVLVPYFLFRKNSLAQFVLVNVLSITAINILYYFPSSHLDDGMKHMLGLMVMATSLFMVAIVAAATGMRYVVRWNELELERQEESRKNAEAELVWLKNQLNPHFLFNTLNNISSLVYVDADKAQESLSQLSDLLRYALYDSRQKDVPLADEVEFMRNYIHLMCLRYDESVDVCAVFPEPVPAVRVIPLVFISPIENAFKHGVNNRKPSFIHLSLTWDAEWLRFELVNSLHPKAATDRVGSGIGIENLRRRLELSYRGRHTYTQQQTETEYRTIITIKP